MKTKSADIVTGAVVMFLGTLTFWRSTKIETVARTFHGADFWPKLISIGLLITGFILLIQGVREKTGDPIRIANKKIVAVSILISTCYIALVDLIGYFVLTPILMVVLGYMLGYRSWRVVASGVLFAFLLYVTFRIALNVPIP